jgi:hypothetical protein
MRELSARHSLKRRALEWVSYGMDTPAFPLCGATDTRKVGGPTSTGRLRQTNAATSEVSP